LISQCFVQSPSFQVGNEGQKQYGCVDVVVKSKLPVVIVDFWQDFFGKDGIETDKEGGAHAKHGSNYGESDLSLNSHAETANDKNQAASGSESRRASQNYITQNDIEDKGQASCDVIEGDFYPFQAKVIEGYHSHKDAGQRKNLFAKRWVVFRSGEL